MAFTVFHGTSNVLEILLYPSPGRCLSTIEITYMLCKRFADRGFSSQMKARRSQEGDFSPAGRDTEIVHSSPRNGVKHSQGTILRPFGKQRETFTRTQYKSTELSPRLHPKKKK
ncbi:hypothetical protein PGIGA_G00073850 [Pangasianodon gigas]|uniref:Uncharacterized protein n=1 Tax=Pangasianodon gigas TaxID=30993 RepID=A0ACC5X7W3_PANGG|nr:hypothetical protein [Pangasianodon gigas]